MAQSLAVDMADEFPDNADELLEAECIEYVPVPWRAKYSEEEWAAKVLALRSSVISEEPETLQQEYVSTVQHHELFGTHFFHVKKVNDVEAIAALPTSMIAAFNSDGLHFCDENRRVLMSYGYADISWRRLCRAVPCVRWRSVATNCATWGAVAQGCLPPARPRRCRLHGQGAAAAAAAGGTRPWAALHPAPATRCDLSTCRTTCYAGHRPAALSCELAHK